MLPKNLKFTEEPVCCWILLPTDINMVLNQLHDRMRRFSLAIAAYVTSTMFFTLSSLSGVPYGVTEEEIYTAFLLFQAFFTIPIFFLTFCQETPADEEDQQR
ncbi:Hypothetical predicted protein [Cloeon dipterum]|uniref:Uncharacterized protein n=1 Tax=Cloeon dipterum TaxID=197152 RepID=A0A8S1DRZ8_9INSE|nr:Hypothetical predicted protein [Cloeon dipterum]